MGEKTKQCSQCFTYNDEDTFYCSKCGSPLEDEEKTLSTSDSGEAPAPQEIRLNSGEVFDRRFRIIEEIGRGGMGRVYKAEDTALKITVALKLILPEMSSDPSFIERFKKETVTARSISHENIIRVYDMGEADEAKYISMEYIKGQSLRDLIGVSGFLTVDAALNLFKKICSGLGAAHKKGIVHRDLKPSNIMVDNTGQAYVMDFGLAAAVGLDFKKRKHGRAGTPQYFAPEQATGGKVDERADIFSLGIILYEMLTGVRPFKAKTSAEGLRKTVSDSPAPPRKIKRHIPPALEAIILRCLEKTPDDRFQSVDEIVAALDRIGPERKPWIVRRWPLAVAGLALLVIGAVYVLTQKTQRIIPGTARITLAVMHMANLSGNPALDDLGRSLTELLIADLLQSQRIRALTGDRLYGILEKLDLTDAVRLTTEDLQRVAALGKADYILQGNLSQAGQVLRLDTTLHEAGTLDLVGTQRAEARGEDGIYDMVDGLTRRIKRDLSLSPEDIESDIDRDVRTITSSSPEALKAYTKGVLLYRERRFKDSNGAFLEAVALDPEFALAYLKISENYAYLADQEKSDEYLAKATSLLNRVSDREFYLIQALAAKTVPETIQYFEKLLELYPDDLAGNGYLGSTYRNLEEWDLALDRFEKIIELDPEDELIYENLAYIYMAKGRYEKSREILTEGQALFPNPIHYHQRMAMAYLCEGNADAALMEAEKAYAINPESSVTDELAGHIYQVKGDYPAAERCYRREMASPDSISQYLGKVWLCHMNLLLGNRSRLLAEIAEGLTRFGKERMIYGVFNLQLLGAYVHLTDGRIPEALEASSKALESALESSHDVYISFASHLRGLVYVKAGRLDEAVREADRLKQRTEERGARKGLRHYHHLMGEVSRARGDIGTAVDYFEIAASLLPEEHHQRDSHVFFLFSLASALLENGEEEKALNTYERITKLTTGRLRWSDRYTLSHYHLAEIHRRRGNREEAARLYREFLGLWSEADPGIPEIGEAARRLEELGVPVRRP